MRKNKNNIKPFIEHPVKGTIFAILVMLLAAYLFFFKSWSSMMPAGSDIPSHLYSSSLIAESIIEHAHIPRINPNWYNSFELFQNAAIFSYLPLGFLAYFLQKILSIQVYATGHIFYFLGTFVMGFGTYILARSRCSNLTSLLIALAIMFNSGFQEQIPIGGSISRMFAFFVFPFALYFNIRILENRKNKKKLLIDFTIFSLLVAASILSHPMSGAALLMFCLMYSVLRGFIDFSIYKMGVFYVILSCFLIAGLTAWYLMPFFIEQQGWVTIHPQVIEMFSMNYKMVSVSLGTFAFFVLLIFSFLRWKKWNASLISIAIVSLLMALFSFGKHLPIYKILPFLTEVYPFIFLMLASIGFYYTIAVILDFGDEKIKNFWIKLFIFSAFVVLIVNNFRITYGYFKQVSIDPEEKQAASSPILDSSHGRVFPMRYPFNYLVFWLGVYEKPTVEGWYYSVTPTGRQLAWLYDAIDYGFPNYAVRYFELSNTRYLLTNINFRNILDYNSYPNTILRDRYGTFLNKLKEKGYHKAFDNQDFQIYKSDEKSGYIQVLNRRILCVGRTAFTPTAVLENSVLGGSDYIDDYSLETLNQFPYLVLDGFKYDDKDKAEELIKQYIESGGTAIIDLSNASSNPREQEYPSFLDVESFREIARSDLKLEVQTDREGNMSEMNLPLPSETKIGDYGVISGEESVSESQLKEWRFTPYVNLDHEVGFIEMNGDRSTIIGYKQYGEGKAWFSGPNLFYYLFLTHNPDVQKIFDSIIPPDPDYNRRPEIFEINDFINDPEYKEAIISSSEDIPLLLSYVYTPHWQISIDDQIVDKTSIQSLTMINFQAGTHKVKMEYVSTWPRIFGSIISWASIAICVFIIAFALTKKGFKNESINN